MKEDGGMSIEFDIPPIFYYVKFFWFSFIGGCSQHLACILSEPPGNLDAALRRALLAREKMPDSVKISDTLGWV